MGSSFWKAHFSTLAHQVSASSLTHLMNVLVPFQAHWLSSAQSKQVVLCMGYVQSQISHQKLAKLMDNMDYFQVPNVNTVVLKQISSLRPNPSLPDYRGLSLFPGKHGYLLPRKLLLSSLMLDHWYPFIIQLRWIALKTHQPSLPSLALLLAKPRALLGPKQGNTPPSQILTRFLSALQRKAGPQHVRRAWSRAGTRFSLSDTPVDSHSLSGGGECIKQHPKQILPNKVEKKLEIKRVNTPKRDKD